MPTLYNGVNLALQAMLAHQQAIEIIENNVANANTPGYHRQVAGLSTSTPTAIYGIDHGGTGQMGTGVTLNQIQRFSTSYFDTQYRSATGDSSKSGVIRDTLQQIEGQFDETGPDSVTTKLNDFYASWQTLSSDPTNTSYRQVLLDKTSALSNAINARAGMVAATRSDANQAIVQRVDEINTLSSQVASLNTQIAQVVGNGAQPNDLLDQRDQILDRLSAVSGAVSSLQTNGEVVVSIGGHVLVAGNNAQTLTTSADPANDNLAKITWSDNQNLAVSSGEIAGYLNVRDVYLTDQAPQAGQPDGLLYDLNKFATGFMAAVNTQHSQGYDLNGKAGLALFTGTGASDMALNTAITDPSMIAAAKSLSANPAPPPANIPAPGDGGNASTIGNFLTSSNPSGTNPMVINGQTVIANDFYNNQMTALGLNITHADNNATYQGQVKDAINMQRQSASGVNLNEEAAEMVKSQRAYEAAARMMTTVDTMLQTVISSMGLVGR